MSAGPNSAKRVRRGSLGCEQPSIAAIGAPDEGRKIATAQAHIPQLPIVKLIELAKLGRCPVARRQLGRKATQLHSDPRYYLHGPSPCCARGVCSAYAHKGADERGGIGL